MWKKRGIFNLNCIHRWSNLPIPTGSVLSPIPTWSVFTSHLTCTSPFSHTDVVRDHVSYRRGLPLSQVLITLRYNLLTWPINKNTTDCNDPYPTLFIHAMNKPSVRNFSQRLGLKCYREGQTHYNIKSEISLISTHKILRYSGRTQNQTQDRKAGSVPTSG